MAKKKGELPQPKRIDLNPSQMQDFLKRVKDRALAEADYEIIEAMTETIQALSQALEEKTTSIKRLLGYLFGAPTETAKNVLPEPASSSPSQKPQGKKKGHGRKGAASYTGAERVVVEHPELKSG